jgi:tRNA(fMet)-specific endonuclease VapC
MTYLVDSDWVADALKGQQAAASLLAHLSPSGLAISLITYGEIYEGIYYGANPRAAERVFLRFLHGVTVLRPNRAVMRLFARVRGQLRSHGMLIGDDDLQIAATAMHHKLILVTRNAKHFQRINGLSLY